MTKRMMFLFTVAALCVVGSYALWAQDTRMNFFVTSVGLGNGGDLGGLDGADQHCQMLADAAGAGDRTWRAYLSTQRAGVGQPGINARARIGAGPWYNAKGVAVAENVIDLHGENNNLTKETALTEKGEMVNGVGDTPNQHDILTGSQADGTAFFDDEDHTCQNWTSSGEGSAQVGHSDRRGRGEDVSPWSAAHASRGCSQSDLEASGGAGLLYCFAR